MAFANPLTMDAERNDEDPADLEDLIERVDETARKREKVSFGDVLDVTGHRSFGPLLLLAGLVMVMPIVGDIPGVPIALGLVVLLISGQMLLRRECFWLPQWMLKRTVKSDKLQKGLKWTKKPAAWIDKFLRPRLHRFVEGAGAYMIAIASGAVALLTPTLELIPFSANLAGAVLTVFGLALVARDGLMAIVGLVLVAGTATAVVFGFDVNAHAT
jgi:hypothetical protein